MDKEIGAGLRRRRGRFTWHYLRDAEDEDEKEKELHGAESVENSSKSLEKRRQTAV